MKPIHMVVDAQQPDIKIVCSGAWQVPTWGRPKTNLIGVYAAGDDAQILYTFNRNMVTCDDCKRRMG